MCQHKQVEDFWKSYLGRESQFQGEKVSREIVRLSKRYIGKRVLDIGAGTGALIKLIPGAVGVDIVARKGIIKANITKLPFPNNSFDTIFCAEVFEHLSDKDLENGLQEVYRVLKKGGYFIVTVPNNEDLEERMVTCPHCGKRFHRVLHLRSFNRNSIKHTLKDFKVVKISQEPYDFNRKIGRVNIKYKHIRFLKPLLNLVKKGNLFVVARKLV